MRSAPSDHRLLILRLSKLPCYFHQIHLHLNSPHASDVDVSEMKDGHQSKHDFTSVFDFKASLVKVTDGAAPRVVPKTGEMGRLIGCLLGIHTPRVGGLGRLSNFSCLSPLPRRMKGSNADDNFHTLSYATIIGQENGFEPLSRCKDGRKFWFQKGGKCESAKNLHSTDWSAGGAKKETVAKRRERRRKEP